MFNPMIDPKKFAFADRCALGALRFGLAKMDNTAADYVVERVKYIKKYNRKPVSVTLHELSFLQRFWYNYANICLDRLSPIPLGWIVNVLIASQRETQKERAARNGTNL